MGIYYPPMRSDELYHWGVKKGEEAKKHKYFARIITGVNKGQNVYRYFYDKKEWDAYVANQRKNLQQRQQTVEPKMGEAQSIGSTSSEPSFLSKLLFGVLGSRIIEAGKNIVNNLLNREDNAATTIHDPDRPINVIPDDNTKDNVPMLKEEVVQQRKLAADANGGIENPEGEAKYKYIAKVPMGDGTFRYFYDQESLAAYYRAIGDELADEFGLRSENTTGEEDRTNINERYDEYPWYDDRNALYSNNCYSCTTAFELRRRGYDVDAIGDDDGECWDIIHSMYENPTTKVYKEPMDSDTLTDKMIADMEAQGDGARGNLCVMWETGGGHSMAWEVVDNHVMIIDNQTHEVYKTKEDIQWLMSMTDTQRVNENYYVTPPDKDGKMWIDEGHTNPNSKLYYQMLRCDPVQWIRTDNCELNEDVIKKYIMKDY